MLILWYCSMMARSRRIAALDEECAVLESTLARVLSEKRQERNSLQPIHSLPDDVFMEIFKILHQHDFPHCRLHSGRVADSPVVLSHVCRRWRSISLDMPSIWSCLHVTVDQTENHHLALETFAQRSRNQPLSVMFIDMSDRSQLPSGAQPWQPTPYDGRTGSRLCWQVILRNCARIRNLAICIDDEDMFEAVQDSLQGLCFPLLEYLGLMLAWQAFADELDGQLDIRAPALTHLRIYDLPIVSTMPLYDRLTELVLCKMVAFDQNDLMKIIPRISSTIERLTLGTFQFHVQDHPGSIRLSFPRLRHLHLQSCRSPRNSQRTLLGTILEHAPSLETFCAADDNSFMHEVCRAPFPLSSVRTVSLSQSFPLYPDAWRNIMDTFPAVETLDVNTTEGAALLRAVGHRSDENFRRDEPPVWQSLRTIDVGLDHYRDVEDLGVFLSHRAEMNLPLQTLNISMDDSDDDLRTYLHAVLANNASGVVSVTYFDGGPRILGPWDYLNDRPRFAPWNGSWLFYDQHWSERH